MKKSKQNIKSAKPKGQGGFSISILDKIKTHGCGCLKSSTKLCQKHGRL